MLTTVPTARLLLARCQAHDLLKGNILPDTVSISETVRKDFFHNGLSELEPGGLGHAFYEGQLALIFSAVRHLLDEVGDLSGWFSCSAGLPRIPEPSRRISKKPSKKLAPVQGAGATADRPAPHCELERP